MHLSDFLREYFNIKTTNESEKEDSDISTECSKEVTSVKIVKTLVPPISRITQNECVANYDDDEISSEEICKQWNCLII